MDATPNLKLPYIAAGQAQKHVTHNEAIRALDALIQIGVVDRNLAAPPDAPVDGDRYIAGPAATGAWTAKSGQIAAYQDGTWTFYAPEPGWLAWIADEAILVVWDGAAWMATSSSGSGAPLWGVNTSADTTNRLAVVSPATLFNHAGSGHQMKINKAAATDTASLVFQDSFSGRAEVGLAGSDDFAIKVSADGANWLTAMLVDRASGEVGFPRLVNAGPGFLINGDFAINQRGFGGGALAANAYGFDRWKAGAAGASVSVSAGGVTLSSGQIVQVVESPGLAGRIVTLSVEDLSGGALTVDIEGQAGSIAAGSGRRGISLTIPAGSTGHVTVRLSPAAGAVSFSRVRLETGRLVSGWTRRDASLELMLCQRYFERLSGATGNRYIRRAVGSMTGPHYFPIQFFAQKRVAPTVTLLGLSYSGASNGQAFNPSFYEFEFYLDVASGGGYAFFGYAADSEL